MSASQTAMDPGDAGFTDLWEDALKAYQAETKREFVVGKLVKSLKNTDDLLAHIESQGEQFRNFRGKHGKLWSRMHTVLGPVAAIGNIASTAINSVAPFGPPVSAVLGAALYLIKACDGVKNAYDWIETLFGEFEMFAIRVKEYLSPTQGIVPALQRRLAAILTCMLRLFGRSEALIQGGRFREYLKSAFLGKDEKTKGLLDDLNTQLKNEQGLVIALTFAATRNAEDFSKTAAETSGRIEDHVEELKQSHAKLAAELESQRLKDVDEKQIASMKQTLETPAADQVARLLSTQSRDLVSGTGAWLEKEALFNSWLNGRAPILWVFGGPGSGKSFLATWTVVFLQKHFCQEVSNYSGTAVAYFYIKDYDTALLEPNNVVKTLALQIAEIDEDFRRFAALACTNRAATVTEDETWEKLFLDFYSSADAQGHCAVLILDGLDEAPIATRKKLLGMIKSVTNRIRGGGIEDRIQFGVFGRPELRGDFEFTRQEKFIEVSPLKNQDDINNFILSRLPELTLVKEMESKGAAGQKSAKKMCRTIAKQVLQGADGVFLWAKLLMKELEELNQIQIGRVLKNPPPSLDEMIHNLFRRISQDSTMDVAEISKMLMLICFAQRPLLFGELKLFLSLPDQQPDILLWRNIRGRLASLFELKYPYWYDPDAASDDGDDDLHDDDGQVEETKDDDLIPPEHDRLPIRTTLSDGGTANDSTTSDNGTETMQTKQEDDDDNDKDDNNSDANNDDDDDDDDDDDADFDFGDESVIHAASFDLGTAPRDSEEAKKYETTIHDDDGQLQTSIRFTHQRIKDFLVADSIQPAKAMETNLIRVNIHRAEIEMTIGCLQALRQGHETKEHRSYLVDYPAKNFVIHLANVKDGYLTLEDTNEIIGGLVQLFYVEQTTKSFLVAADGVGEEGDTGRDEFWAMWLSNQQHREVVQKWLRKPEADKASMNEEAKLWIRQARTSIKTLLKPMMKGAAQRWLTKTGYDDEGYRDKSQWLVDVIRAYMSMDESGCITDETFKDWSWLRSNSNPAATSAALHEAAEWAQLEKTTHWYTGLGWILMDYGFADDAIIEYNKAIELDSKAWVAMEGKARCLGQLDQYEEAIETMTGAIDNLPTSMISITAFLLPWLSSWKEIIGDKSGSYEAAVKAWETDAWSPIAQSHYISALCADEDRYQDAVDTLQWMHGQTTMNGYSLLVRFFNTGYDRYNDIGLACSKCGKPEFVLEAIDQSLAWCENKVSQSLLLWMMNRSANSRYRYYSQVDEAVKLWERCLTLVSEALSEDAEAYREYRSTIVNTLSLIHFDMAVDAKEADQGFSRLAAKLKELSVAIESSLESGSFEFYDSGYPSLLWGRWLREYEGAQDSEWRKPFRSRLLDQMNMLDDDDPANDTYALKALATSLFHAGDEKNAGAILAIIFKLLEDEIEKREQQPAGNENKVGDDKSSDEADQEQASGEEDEIIESQSSETANAEETFIGPSEATPADLEAIEKQKARKVKGSELQLAIDSNAFGYYCDNCGQDIESSTEMYFCEVCEDINWCGDCVQLVRDNALPKRMCNPKHPLYRAWPIPEEARNSAATWLDGQAELRRDWLEALRKEWL